MDVTVISGVLVLIGIGEGVTREVGSRVNVGVGMFVPQAVKNIAMINRYGKALFLVIELLYHRFIPPSIRS